MRRPGLAAVAVLLLAGCTADPGSRADEPSPTATAATERRSKKPEPTKRPTNHQPTRPAEPRLPPDPRWVFFTDDHRRYASPWFAGRHRIMIPFGCTPAPYYDPDPTCPDGQGKHHGIDIAMPCGTPLLAGRALEVLDNSSLGSAYGDNPLLLRVDGFDLVVAHTHKVFVAPGDQVAPGERFALASDSGAPDGCHLHFEVRPAGGDYTSALDPGDLIGLHR